MRAHAVVAEMLVETVSRQQWAAEQMEALAKRVSQMQQLVEGQLQQVSAQPPHSEPLCLCIDACLTKLLFDQRTIVSLRC